MSKFSLLYNQPLHRTPSALARLGAGERRR